MQLPNLNQSTGDTMASMFSNVPSLAPAAEGKSGKAKGETSSPKVETNGFAFTLEDSVEMPKDTGKGKPSKYPWEAMAKGQSFFVPHAKKGTFYTLCNSASKKYSTEEAPKKFTSKTWTEKGVEGVRVWRTE